MEEGKDAKPRGGGNASKLVRKRAKKTSGLIPGSVAPRNQIEAMFLEKFGTVTPVPEVTMRRSSNIVLAAIQYIHHNKTFSEIERMSGAETRYIRLCASEDKWDQFRQQLSQMARPSALAMFEPLDLERIEIERKRRLSNVDKLIAEEERITKAISKMPAGSKELATAIANIQKIRQINAAAIGLSMHESEHSAARSTLLSAAAQKLIKDGEAQAPSATKGTIFDV